MTSREPSPRPPASAATSATSSASRSPDTRFLFRFETDGSLTAYQALKAALGIIQDKFDVMEKTVAAKVK